MNRAAYIVSAVRTPMGKFGGALRELTAADLGVAVPRAALERAGVEAQHVDEVILGCARQAGVGPNVARQIAVRALGPALGAPVPAFTLNQACGPGLPTRAVAAERIATGQADCVLAGGAPTQSRGPLLPGG